MNFIISRTRKAQGWILWLYLIGKMPDKINWFDGLIDLDQIQWREENCRFDQ